MFACVVCMYNFIWIYEKEEIWREEENQKRNGSTVDMLKYEYNNDNKNTCGILTE